MVTNSLYIHRQQSAPKVKLKTSKPKGLQDKQKKKTAAFVMYILQVIKSATPSLSTKLASKLTSCKGESDLRLSSKLRIKSKF
jgi:hypothetical protein